MEKKKITFAKNMINGVLLPKIAQRLELFRALKIRHPIMISFKVLNSYQRFNMVLSENRLYQISHPGIKKILFNFSDSPSIRRAAGRRIHSEIMIE